MSRRGQYEQAYRVGYDAFLERLSREPRKERYTGTDVCDDFRRAESEDFRAFADGWNDAHDWTDTELGAALAAKEIEFRREHD